MSKKWIVTYSIGQAGRPVDEAAAVRAARACRARRARQPGRAAGMEAATAGAATWSGGLMGGSPMTWNELLDFLPHYTALSRAQTIAYIEVVRAASTMSADEACRQIPAWHAHGVTPDTLRRAIDHPV
jgi:hypothetical protein